MSTIKVVSRGELGHRLSLSSVRLEGRHYLPDYIWSADKNCWPGDWEGRTILALVSLAKSTGKEPAYLEEIMDRLESHLNARGYMGEVEKAMFSEQQFAGNSWLLRGLIEYTEWKETDRFADVIKKIIENLYLPAVDAVQEYPLQKINKDGDYSGSIIAVYKSWKMSTDIGCMYISLDGITRAYEFSGDSRLLELIDRMIKRFGETDNVAQGFQTHATLSCLRGIIRAYRVTGKDEYLRLAVKRFDDYLRVGLTENYENNHLFHSHKWTEPCGIIDSYICCVELFKITNRSRYLDIAQKIYFNGICRVQLPNGGFALDECLGYNPVETLNFKKTDDGKPVEAYWCCTMRGADGLSYVHANQCIRSNNKYVFINYFDCSVLDDDIEIKVKGDYPYEGKVNFFITNPTSKQIKLSLFIPECAKNAKVRINGKEIQDCNVSNAFLDIDVSQYKAVVLLSFDIDLEIRKSFVSAEHFTMWHGNLILGSTDINTDIQPEDLVYLGKGQYKYLPSEKVLSCIGDTFEKSDESVNATLRLLF